jgi:MtN3 and saliva related transmembrane protein
MNDLVILLLGLVAGAVTSIGFVPQLIRGFRTKKLDDVSYYMPVVLAIGLALWFAYGYFLNALAIMAANAFGVGCCILLIAMKRKYSGFGR